MRCYTTVDLTLDKSVLCGSRYSCLKVSQPPPIFNIYGEFVPPERRGGHVTKYRGCFVLDMKQDVCFMSSSGLEYCWCSSKDLCNHSNMVVSRSFILSVILSILLSI